MASDTTLVSTLLKIVRHLNQARLQYALAGGWAYSALVEPRATTDIDLLIVLPDTSREAIGRLFAPLFDTVVAHGMPMRFKDLSIWRVVGIRNQQEVVVDLLLAESEFLQHALNRAQPIEFFGQNVPILTLEDLIVMKECAGRLQDRADLEKIRQRQTELQIDRDYVHFWKTKLGVPGNG